MVIYGMWLLWGLLYSPSLAESFNSPLQIAVTENFNGQPNLAARSFPITVPNFLHQGANFFFNPNLQIAPGFVPPHLEALTAIIKPEKFSAPTETIKESVVIDCEKEAVLLPNDTDLMLEAPVEESIEIVKQPGPVDIAVVENYGVIFPQPQVILETEPVPEVAIVEEKLDVLPTPTIVVESAPEFVSEFVGEPIMVEEELVPVGLPSIPPPPVLPPLVLSDLVIPTLEEIKVEPEIGLPCNIESSDKLIINEVNEPAKEMILQAPPLPVENIVQKNPCVECILLPNNRMQPISLPMPNNEFTSVPIISRLPAYSPFVEEKERVLYRSRVPSSILNKHSIMLPKSLRLPILSSSKKRLIPDIKKSDRFSHLKKSTNNIIGQRVAPKIGFKQLLEKRYKKLH